MRDLAAGEDRKGWTKRPGYQTFLPQTKTIRIVRGKRLPHCVPMIAGYGFVRFDALADDWKPIVSCPGVMTLFSTRSMRPIPVSDAEVDLLTRASEKDLGIDPLAMPKREKNDQLRVVDGPFTSFLATCVSCDGFATTADVWIFGRSVPVTLPWSAFEAV